MRALGRVIYELAAIVIEMARIPARAWMRVAEVAGAIVLALARAAWPLAVAGWRLAGTLVSVGARIVTPARAGTAVTLAAAIALGASQFTDYRAVMVDEPQYRGVEGVAAPPAVAIRDPRSAHGDWLLVVAGAAVVVIAVAATGRTRAARLLVPLGATAVAVALLHDHGTGLQAGRAAVSYEGAKPVLLDGYRTEIVAGAVLALGGPLIALGARRAPRPERSRVRRRLVLRRPRSRVARAAG